MKKNSKSKAFSTMLDTICNFLVDRKNEEGGSEPAAAPKKKPARPDDKARGEKKQQEPVTNWGFDPPA
jgi:hypothetical protein